MFYARIKEVEIWYAIYLGHSLGNFYARRLKFDMLLTQPFNTARVAPWSCPGVGLGIQRVGVFLCTLDKSSFNLKVIFF